MAIDRSSCIGLLDISFIFDQIWSIGLNTIPVFYSFTVSKRNQNIPNLIKNMVIAYTHKYCIFGYT